jgi:DNA-binding helix-hairpin-helix protein with protein kinase domain
MIAGVERVVTDSGQEYRLGEQIGRGGQGAVFAVDGQPRAVKILESRSARERERLREQITFVQGRPLDGLPLARPLELLRAPVVGYVMELLTEMVALDLLMRPPTGDQDPMAWYISTGGLRRRLRLLGRAADAFAQLHAIPLVYMDPSPGNILISRHADSQEVWLIDTDNLHCISSPARTLYGTPMYVAPELARGFTGPTSLSDAYSFAVIAFETLAQTHPFEGELVFGLGPDDARERIDRGEVPWALHPEDRRNRPIQGIEPDLILTKSLQDAFHRALGSGLAMPAARPGMAEWAELLHAAADLTILCPGCRGSYYPRTTYCPWCGGPRPAFVLVQIRRWHPTGDNAGTVHGRKEPYARLAVTAGETGVLTERLTRAASGAGSHRPCLELTLKGTGMEVRAADGRPYYLTETQSGKHPKIGGGKKIPCSLKEGEVLLHFGLLHEPHRLATFQFYPEVRQ